VLRILMIFL